MWRLVVVDWPAVARHRATWPLVVMAAGPGHAPAEGQTATALPGYAPIDLGSGWGPAAVVTALMGAALALALLLAAVVVLRRARVEARARRVETGRSTR